LSQNENIVLKKKHRKGKEHNTEEFTAISMKNNEIQISNYENHQVILFIVIVL
jgi:hypothetical protein